MGNSGLKSGLQMGNFQGVKAGRGIGNIETGLVSGLNNGNTTRRKLHNPVAIKGTLQPYCYWNADNVTLSGSTVTDVTNLNGTAGAFTVNGSPTISLLSVGRRSAIDLSSNNDSVQISAAGNAILSNTNQATVSIVFRTTDVSATLYANQGSTITSTRGDFFITTTSTDQIQIQFWSDNPGNVIYRTGVIQNLQTRYHTLTVKFDLQQRYGVGSEVEVILDGMPKPLDLVSSTFVPNSLGFVSTQQHFGNNKTLATSLSFMASGFLCGYWMSDSQQIMLENFYRWYYGINF